MAKKLLTVCLFYVILFLTACSSTPTPNLEATVQAAIEATEDAQPTDTPTPKPPNTLIPTVTLTPKPTFDDLAELERQATDNPLPTNTPIPKPPLEFINQKASTGLTGGIEISGEVKNNTDEAIGPVKITAEFYNNGVKDISIFGDADTLVDVIPPNSKVPFKITSLYISGPNSSYKLLANLVESKPTVVAEEGGVNLRSGPGTEYEVVGTLSAGENLEIIGRNNASSWWQVSTPTGPGWVAASVVSASNVDERIPIAEAPPPPTPAPTVIANTPTPVPPNTFIGSGEQLVYFTLEAGGPVIFSFEHQGSYNFVVWLRNKKDLPFELLVNVIGPYSDDVSIELDPGDYSLSVEAREGNWKFAVNSDAFIHKQTIVPTPTATRDPSSSEGVCSCSGDIYNCSSFSFQSSAQECFNYCKSIGAGDIHKLDQDNDGRVCESLP